MMEETTEVGITDTETTTDETEMMEETTEVGITDTETTTDESITKTTLIVVSSTLTKLNKSVEWNDSLLDPQSDLYVEYSNEICTMLVNSVTLSNIEGLINVTCGNVVFSPGSVVSSAVLTIKYNTSSWNLSSSEMTSDTVRVAIKKYVEERIANGSDEVYFSTSSDLEIQGE
ncbi:hypothetical protein KSF78_0005132 [Schistosoma japonicum]|nr:hypothetical protein KSF78_0005132 [Schistosoma japonicum]